MKRWIIGIVVVALLVVVGGPFVYFHFIEGDPPPKLSIDSLTPSTADDGTTAKPGTTRAPLAGTWKIGDRLRRPLPREGDAVRSERAPRSARRARVTGSMTSPEPRSPRRRSPST